MLGLHSGKKNFASLDELGFAEIRRRVLKIYKGDTASGSISPY
jgi:hypothetical protein